MEHILGQSRARRVLDALIKSGRLHHAYIFHGPAGVGKFTTAMAFAKTLLCQNQDAEKPCNTCPSCQRLGGAQPPPSDGAAAAHPDLHVVTKELALYSDDSSVRARKLLSIPVAVLRKALLEPVYLASQMGHSKVFILDEAELLNETGQNLLLKTLEEPPPKTFLILVTSHEDRLLTTIRSRCHRVAFAPLPDDQVGQLLDRFAGQNQDTEDLPPDQRQWLIEFSAGSPGRAQLALQYDLFDWAALVCPAINDMTRGECSTDLGRQMAELIDEFAQSWVKNHANASKDAANKQAARLMWNLIAHQARSQIARIAKDLATQDADESERRLTPWMNAIDALSQGERELRSNVNLGLVCEHLVSLLYRALNASETTVLR